LDRKPNSFTGKTEIHLTKPFIRLYLTKELIILLLTITNMDNQNKNPLEDLLIDESQSVNLVELAQMLKPYVGIEKSSKDIQFLPAFYEQKNELKILILLAASKAKKELLGGEEKMSPSEIIVLDIMPPGSVKGTLKKLFDEKIIKSDDSKYYLPNYQIKFLQLKNQKNG